MQSQAKASKPIRSQLLRLVTQNPGDFPLKQRFPLPASASGALGEAWVPSAPQWPPRTTACPAKHHGSHRLEKLISMGKGRKRNLVGNNCPGSRQGVLFLSKHRTHVRKHGLPKPYFPWMGGSTPNAGQGQNMKVWEASCNGNMESSLPESQRCTSSP